MANLIYEEKTIENFTKLLNKEDFAFLLNFLFDIWTKEISMKNGVSLLFLLHNIRDYLIYQNKNFNIFYKKQEKFNLFLAYAEKNIMDKFLIQEINAFRNYNQYFNIFQRILIIIISIIIFLIAVLLFIKFV